jgi:outer membrane lipoprotein-sorting protein
MKVAALVCAGLAWAEVAGQTQSGMGPSGTTETLDRSRKAYAALKSYADSGTVVVENASKGVDLTTSRYTFKTYYRAPSHFLFEFNKEAVPGADHYVAWGDARAFHMWSAALGEDTYPPGFATTAFSFGNGLTLNTVLKVAPLVYRVEELWNILTEFGEPKDTGSEPVGGRPCRKVEGLARWLYLRPYTKVVNARQATVWIDAETMLVRKVFEDTPKEHFTGDVHRVTTTFEPQSNPPLEDNNFTFTAPK